MSCHSPYKCSSYRCWIPPFNITQRSSTVQQPPVICTDLALSVTTIGGIIIFSIRNNGPLTAPNVVLTLDLTFPNFFTIAQLEAAVVAIVDSITTQGFQVLSQSIGPGASASIIINIGTMIPGPVIILALSTSSQLLSAAGVVTSSINECNPSNNTAASDG